MFTNDNINHYSIIGAFLVSISILIIVCSKDNSKTKEVGGSFEGEVLDGEVLDGEETRLIKEVVEYDLCESSQLEENEFGLLLERNR